MGIDSGAPPTPCCSECGFQIGGEGCGVGDDRAGERRTESRPKLGKSRRIPRQLGGDLEVVLMILGDEFGQPQAHQQARTGAGCVRVTRERDNRHAHPQGIATGGVAVERKRIERDIDRLIQLEIVGVGLSMHKLEPLGGDMVIGEEGPKASLAFTGSVGQEHEP